MLKFENKKNETMKRKLLFAAVMLSGLANAQSFNQSNEPIIGDQEGYFLCDSNAVNYAAVTGTGVTWDYSNIAGVTGVTKSVEVIDASTSSFYGDFPGSEKAISIAGAVTTFFSSSASNRTSQGFVYSEPTFGDVVAKWTNDPELLFNYPMSTPNGLVDIFSGNLLFEFNGIPQNTVCNGNITAAVDGSGTLLLPDGNSYDAVRYKMIDSAFTTVILLGSIEVIRTQFEYYDHSISNLPVFIHSNIKIQSVGSTTPLTEQTLVMSKDEPQYWLGISEAGKNAISLYPNPAQDKITITGIETGSADVRIIDQSGRVIRQISEVLNGQQIDVSTFESGIYLFEITNEGHSSIQRITVR
jgi:hypothetical protein